MPRYPDTAATANLGVNFVDRVCSRGRTVFREVSKHDVGIDGFIEFVERGHATGIHVGVQVKSGRSFVSDDGNRFTFAADREHFGYWARCSFPVVGIVYSPHYDRAVWLDLTEASTDDRIRHGPLAITLDYSAATGFTPEALNQQVRRSVTRWVHQRRSLAEIQSIMAPVAEPSSLQVPSVDASGDRHAAWAELITQFVSPSSSIDAVLDAGYRLSWYFPAVDEAQKEAVRTAMRQLEDAALLRIVGAVSLSIEVDDGQRAEHLVDLLSYNESLFERLRSALEQQQVTEDLRAAASAILERHAETSQ